METRFYQAQELDIQRIAFELANLFLAQGYQAQHFGDKGHMVVQLRKGGDFAAIVGMQAALTLSLHGTPGGVMAVIGQQQWADKAAVGAVGMLILWPLAFTAGAGVIRQANLVNQVLATLDSVVRQQQANVHIGPPPPQLVQQMQMQMQQQPVYPPSPAQQPAYPPPPAQWAAPTIYPPQTPPPAAYPAHRTPPPPPPPGHRVPAAPAPAKIPCPQCQALNDADNLFCARCGKPMQQPEEETLCPHCEAKVPADAAFCTKCGEALTPPPPAPAEIAVAPTTDATVAVNMTPATQLVQPEPVVQVWGTLQFADGDPVELTGTRITVGRVKPESNDAKPDINLYSSRAEAATVSRSHAVIELQNDQCMLTDLKSTNHTFINKQQLEPDKPTPFTDGDSLQFGKIACIFKKS
jgi:hypothetical protein